MEAVSESEQLRARLDLPHERLLVLTAPAVQPSPDLLAGGLGDAVVRRVGQRVPDRSHHDAVVLLAHDLVDLRLAATGIGQVGSAHVVVVLFARQPLHLPSLVWRPEWPRLECARVQREPDAVVRLRFAEPVAARSVIAHLARSSTPSSAASSSWPVLGVHRDDPGRWTANDPAAAVAGPRRLFEAAGDLPPDVVLAEDAPESPADPHPVLGRAPVVVRAEPELTWAEASALDATARTAALGRRGTISLGPVDELVLNPIGFDREPRGRPLPLRSRPDGALVARFPTGDETAVADEAGRVSDSDVPWVRRLPGLQLDWFGGRGPQSYCRALTQLACLGVPLVADAPPPWAGSLLSPDLLEVLGHAPDLGDALEREEHSIRLRRTALTHHATPAWRRSVALGAGAQSTPPETVSVLLATRRPEQLDFALGQVARQRGVDLELVLATHGFTADPRALARFATLSEASVSVVEVAAETLFGEVLNRAAARAQGAVLAKMDDDDWYGPDFLRELLLARRYSGAGLVGALPELTYLEQLGVTTRRAGPTEVFSSFVAGGTMLVDAAALRSIGGFRATRKYVDAALLRGLTNAGVPVYRTHGLGYVLRRSAEGHTWDPGLDWFLHPDRMAVRWQGFRPSALLESSPGDLPPHVEAASTARAPE